MLHDVSVPRLSGLARALLVAGACLSPGLAAGPALAATPLGGLTVAVSPDGRKLVAGGDTRTILVMDPKTLAVKSRVFLGPTIVDLAFDRTGGILAVGDTDGTVHLVDATKWTTKASVRNRHKLTVSTTANLFAGIDSDYQATAVFVHALADGAEKAKLVLPQKARVAALGFSPDGKRLAVLVGPIDSKDEKKATSAEIPKDLRGLDRREFEQKNDGKVGSLLVFEAASGKLLSEKPTHFSMNGVNGLALFAGDAVVVNDYGNVGARIEANGDTKLFELANSYNYGLGRSIDGKLILSGGLRAYSITDAASLQGVKGEIDKLPGWPEYFKGFDATADGQQIYGATTGYRVFLFDRSGKVVASAPVM
jgi:WD40 repeat protein